jgi:hypothetical protein
MKCDYCSKEKHETIFMIGAKSDSNSKEWCMVYGTGKMACPDCYPAASKEGSAAVDNHIKQHNERVQRKQEVS